MTKLMIGLSLIALCAAAGFTQPPPTAILASYEPVTVTGDGKGELLPEGTEIRIRWDWDANGADEKDPLPVVGEELGQATVNRFEVNGTRLEIGAGTFFSDMPLTIRYVMPDPPLYYLEICLDDHMLRSQVFEIKSGPQEINQWEWTVVKETCKEMK